MRPLADGLPGALTELLNAAPLSDGKVTFAWGAAVGPALQRVTAVKLDRRVLLVETTSTQWSREIMRSSPMILKRLRQFLSTDIDRIETRTNPHLQSAINQKSAI